MTLFPLIVLFALFCYFPVLIVGYTKMHFDRLYSHYISVLYFCKDIFGSNGTKAPNYGKKLDF